MMKTINKLNRPNQILVLALIVQIALMLVVFWPRGAAGATASGAKLFPDLKTDQVVGMVMRDSEGKTVQLAKKNDAWVIPSADDYPARDADVKKFIDNLAGLKADRLVTETANSHKKLKVAADAYERAVEIDLADGSKKVLYMGSAPTYQVTHMRVDGQDKVYLVSGMSSYDAGVTASFWVDTTYLAIVPSDVTHVTVQNKNGKFEFSKDANSNWSMDGLAAGEQFDPQPINGTVSSMETLRLVEPLGKTEKPEYGMAQAATVTIVSKPKDGAEKTVTLKIGAKLGDQRGYAAISSESPYYVELSEYAAKDFVEWTHTSFLVTPTPAPTPGTPAPGATAAP
jgi:hypothetical protein